MYLKKSPAPRTAMLPDGSILTAADLPDCNTRWVASRKEIVVNAVTYGLLSCEEALLRYDLTEEEFNSWKLAVKKHGREALKVTSLQRFKQP